ncbi:MAG: aspartate kinase, partial [Spirochaetaceae bacterium]|nr:aspartate kinase [Spirochaetaceae bacterium]
MVTVKFGGTSMGSAERIYTAADIIHERAGKEDVSVIVSAVAGVSNLLQESITACTTVGNSTQVSTATVPAEQVPAAVTERVRSIHGKIIAEMEEKLPSFNIAYVNGRLEPLFAEYERLLNAVAAFGECPVSIHCRIMGMGELFSAPIMEETLRCRGLDIALVDSRDVIFTVGFQAEGDPDYTKTNAALSPYRASGNAHHRVLLFPGFICSWEGGTSSTGGTSTAGGVNSAKQMGLLGRNGSDFSAAIIAVGLGAQRLEIWTDVDGIYTADPRIVKDAILVDEMSYEEAMELSFFGSKVLHPKTLIPIAAAGIETWSLNSMNRSARGTRIVSRRNIKEESASEASHSAPQNAVQGISCLKNTAMISVSGNGMKGRKGTAARLFAAVSRGGISVLLITQSSSEYTISFCVQEAESDRVIKVLESEFEFELREKLINPIEVQKRCAIVSIIGDGMKAKKGTAAVFFSALASRDINIIAIAQGSSERSISTVISGEDGDTAVRVAHRFFFDT